MSASLWCSVFNVISWEKYATFFIMDYMIVSLIVISVITHQNEKAKIDHEKSQAKDI